MELIGKTVRLRGGYCLSRVIDYLPGKRALVCVPVDQITGELTNISDGYLLPLDGVEEVIIRG